MNKFSIVKKDLNCISEYIWEIPKSYREDMRVPARVYASELLLEEIFRDRSLEQIINVATLSGIQGAALAMPDAHEGYGFPIGGVATMEYPDGIISPGGIGYDINCGVRLLRSRLQKKDTEPYLENLAQELYREIPSGVGRGGKLKLNTRELDSVLKNGINWAIEQKYAAKEDARHIESNGVLENADPSLVSNHAKKRGKDQLGTMGAGNHFVEVQVVNEIFHKEAAQAFGISENQIVVMIHTGSRGLGHQVATDYIRMMMRAMAKYKIKLPDRELAGVPFSSPEGQNYFAAMAAAANFAWCNRQLITYGTRNAWKKIFGSENLSVVYDVAHNMAKIEVHKISGGDKKVIVHRKGATRAFGPEHPELAEEYRKIGQPVLIPGSMGTASYVLVGTKEAMETSFGTTCHGAGRRMSRHEAKKRVWGENLKKELESKGIHIATSSLPSLAEEAPDAYKNVDEVVNTVNNTQIAKKVAKLLPLAVVKG
jgi:tRNA-splicing ligase RtcB